MAAFESSFKALWVEQPEHDSVPEVSVITRSTLDLPAGELLVRVEWSSLNFKDALSVKGNRGVTKQYPHTPGIDAAGYVEVSDSPQFKPGDAVIITGYDLGMNTAGGFGGYIRVPAEWAVALPEGMSLKDSMAYGTAGLTAALCLEKLETAGMKPGQGDIFVTGATGGVGSLSISMLSGLGYSVAASTGKLEHAQYLTSLGATKIVDRETISDGAEKALLKEQWAGAIDTVGGDILFNVIKSLKYGASVACCGMVSSPSFGATVFPFILRNVNLLGVDSARQPAEARQRVWNRLAGDLQLKNLDRITTEVDLHQLPDAIEQIFRARQIGRVVLRHDH
ncbi:YhdH/YhfP family quinone oxidoreductase [Endozoicomonadaceae bacterium StTr2]